MSRFRNLSLAVAGAVVAVSTLVVAAPGASAAAPRCAGWGYRHHVNASGWVDREMFIIFPAHSPDERVEPDVGEGYWSCSLVQGSTGDGVAALQQNINSCYYPGVIDTKLEEDGQFGRLTKAALVAVQQRHGIEANGQYGPQTARTMYHIYNNWRDMHSGCSRLDLWGWPGNSR
jgi:hypothetical protein